MRRLTRPDSPRALAARFRKRCCGGDQKAARIAAEEAAREEAARAEAAAEEERQAVEAKAKAERAWARAEKRSAKPNVAPADFAASFVNARVQAAEKAKHFEDAA